MQNTHKHLTSRTAIALAALAVSPLAHAGDGFYGGGGGLAGQELIRRQQAVASADELLIEGREAYAKGEYETAVSKYREALNILPFGTATADRRAIITKHWEDGSIALSQNYRRLGKYNEARTLLTEVVEADPGNVQATKHLEYLDDPIRTNPALTFEHSENIDKVRRLLYTGEGFYNNGQYDKAIDEFHAVLRIDPYNKAARRWMERVNAIKSDYYRAAYDETRSRLLSQVDAAWEMSVPPVGAVGDPSIYKKANENNGSLYISQKLQQIRIPIIDFEDVTVEEAIDFLRQRSRELDTTTQVESEKGINFIIRRARVEAVGGDAAEGLDEAVGGLGSTANVGEKRIKSLKLKNVPLATALQYICDQAKLRYKVDEFAVTLLPLTAGEEDEILTRRWQVPPDFMSFLDTGGGGGDAAGGGDPFETGGGFGGDGGNAIKVRGNVQDLLTARGVKFNESSSASYLPGTSTLLVRSTPSQLELVEAIVDESTINTPKQIKILTKFVEVSQENSDELGFDWIVSPFGISSEFIPAGGTIGSGVNRNNGDFINLGGAVPGIGSAAANSVNNIITAGNRTGDSALSRNSIDAILNNPSRTAQNANVAPGILSLTGLFSGGQVQMIMRGLAQKKGTDIMTAPSIMARPGQKATIEIIREFIYPTEYEPPELPNSVGVGAGVGGGGGGAVQGGGTFPVTPATPTAFETRNTGVTLEIEPNVGANDSLIELRFAPEIVEFEGFINYGSPITAPAVNPLTGASVPLTITENRIEMPVFATRRVTTGITIYDGYTVAVGGLMREDVQNVEDSVPILGDLPLIGRLFQTKAENRIKSNLIIFVTAEIIDATGRRLNPTSGLDTTNGIPSTPTIGGGSDTMLPPL